MTPADYYKLLEEQGGTCKICKGKSFRKKFDVDHCHESGKVRGLLCSNCNTALGLMKDDPVRLAAAIEYLKEK